jgi:serine protease inhibitor
MQLFTAFHVITNIKLEVIKLGFNRLKKTIILMLTAIISLTGCTSANITGSQDLMLSVKGVSWPDAPDKLDERLQQALFDFSWSLFQESVKNEGNVLISPASVYLALGMTLNGADSNTHQAMIEALKAGDLTEEEFNAACRDYISILQVLGEKTELSIANSIWYGEGFKPDKDFLQRNADYFAASAQTLDFSKPAAVNTINNWVKKETRNTIDKIIDRIDADVVMYLINAVYFKSDWQNPFDAADTREMDFRGTNGTHKAQFMNSSRNIDYIDNGDVKGVMLPYDDGRFSFFALLPEEGKDVREFVESLDGKSISSYLADIESGYIRLSLPKFETRFEDSLKDELTNLGMGVAFDSNNADFSRMNEAHEKNLYISEVKHKTFCRVDEKGSEAAAVTSVEMRVTGMPLDPEVQIIFDRPFVYGIVDTVTGAPLFIGLMENPTK